MSLAIRNIRRERRQGIVTIYAELHDMAAPEGQRIIGIGDIEAIVDLAGERFGGNFCLNIEEVLPVMPS